MFPFICYDMQIESKKKKRTENIDNLGLGIMIYKNGRCGTDLKL